MARKKRELTPENLTYFQRKHLINRIRQATMYWPYKNVARNKAKRKIEVGTYKNGNPRYVIKYECESCKGLFDEIEMDHIKPIVNTEDGFVDWNTYINGALCDSSNFSPKCRNCHQAKTDRENKKRTKSQKKMKK